MGILISGIDILVKYKIVKVIKKVIIFFFIGVL